MANPLQRGNVPPPPPDLMNQSALPQGPVGPNALMAQGGPMAPMAPGASGAGGQPMPAPTHAQTVAGLRHFGALAKELETLQRNPNLGKSDVRKDIIEGVTQLVADEFMTAAQAVTELGTVPERPFEQKMWVANHLRRVMTSAAGMLDHHRAAFPGTLDYPTESAMTADPANHAADMSGLMSHYGQA